MDRHYTLRVGLTAILCALMIRFFDLGIPGKLLERLLQPDTAAFLIYLETGRDVRFSPSSEVFSPDFMESPPAAATQATEPPIPSFSDPEAISLYYASTKEPDIAALLAQPLEWELRGDAPTVLILHTHATESYTRQGEPYRESSDWRTLDEDYNMLSIGAQVQQALALHGITALQDRTLHDHPSYNGSYAAARKTVQQYLEQYPTIRLVLDLHRDAAERSYGQLRTSALYDGRESAQLMLVLGANHDGYEENLSLALKLHAQLETLAPGIARPLQLRASRFNQDLCPGSLLVEVGAAGDSHAEAMVAADALAQAVAALARGTQ